MESFLGGARPRKSFLYSPYRHYWLKSLIHPYWCPLVFSRCNQAKWRCTSATGISRNMSKQTSEKRPRKKFTKKLIGKWTFAASFLHTQVSQNKYKKLTKWAYGFLSDSKITLHKHISYVNQLYYAFKWSYCFLVSFPHREENHFVGGRQYFQINL